MPTKAYGSKFFLICLCFGLFSSQISSQTLSPREPNPPMLPTLDTKAPSAEEPSKFSLEFTLCDGRTVSGTWRPKKSVWTFQHSKQGIQYKKTIKFSELQAITYQNFEGTKGKEDTNGARYTFYPKNIKLDLKSGESLEKENGLEGSEFLSLEISNVLGETTLHSYWRDLLKPDGSWFRDEKKKTKVRETIPKKISTGKLEFKTSYEIEECFPDVVQKIRFE